MNKPFYQSRKFWTAVITVLAALAVLTQGGEKGQAYATVIVTLGRLLLAGFGMEDVGKSGKALEVQTAVKLADVLREAKEAAEGILELDATPASSEKGNSAGSTGDGPEEDEEEDEEEEK